jgi:hypothetical protein
MYNQVIGPDENSNKQMKPITRRTVGYVHGFEPSLSPFLISFATSACYRLQYPVKTKQIAIKPPTYSIIVLLPNLNSKESPPKVAEKLTTPTMNVIISGEIPPKDAKIVLE